MLEGNYAAVKSIICIADVKLLKAFLMEIKNIHFIGEHPNILGFFGAVTEEIQDGRLLVAFEFSSFGNLSNYLTTYAGSYVGPCSEEDLQDIIPPVSAGSQLHMDLNPSVLIRFCKQIATAMAYIAQKKVVHRDLATRNILVFHNNVVKITDFELSVKLYECPYYIQTQAMPLPWRWMALESLLYMEFSSQSDVWSFGVTVWEIFSLGKVPYSGLTWSSEFIDEIEAGLRPSTPEHALPEVLDWMMKCWENEPKKRPTFLDCQGFFTDIQLRDHQEDNIYGALDS